MIVIIFRSSSPILIHAVEKGNTVGDIYYYIENGLSPAFESIKRQRVSSGLCGIKLLRDNAKPHIHFDVRKFIE